MKIESWNELGFNKRKFITNEYTVVVSVRLMFQSLQNSYFVSISCHADTLSGFSTSRTRGSRASALDAFKASRHALDLELFRRL